MALTLGDNFSYQGAKPLDGRLKYDTLAAMKAVADATMYDGCMAYCTGTDKTYQWKSTNTVDETLGRWREFSSGGGSSYTAGDGIDITNDVISTKQSEEGDIDKIIGSLPSGGMGVTLVNAFNKSDLYSTDEKMIGQGYDGKPLYQKTVSVSISATGWNTASHGISNFDKCVNAWGMAYRADVNMWFAGCSNSVNIGFYMDGTNVACSVDDTRVTQIYITVQYTKTTDSAVSIGTANEYSTDEKIVGTWITGEPVYQRTLDLGDNYAITTADKTVGTYSYIKQLINAVYIVTASASNLYASTVTSAYMDGNTLHTLATQQWGGATNRNIYLNIQYTKTT